MADKPQPTPWGEMIRVARDSISPRLSVPAAAKRAGVSRETWGYVERGYQLHRGQYRFVAGTPGTVAKMAHVVGLTPERLSQAGNDQAAVILAEILRREAESAPDKQRPAYADPTLDYLSRTPGLPDDVVRGLIVLARNWRDGEQQTG